MRFWILSPLAVLLLASCSQQTHSQANAPLASQDATVRVIAPGQEAGSHLVQYQVTLQGWKAGLTVDSVRDDFGPLEFRVDETTPAEPKLIAWRFVSAFKAPERALPGSSTRADASASTPGIPAKGGTLLSIAYHSKRTHVLRISTLRLVAGPPIP